MAGRGVTCMCGMMGQLVSGDTGGYLRIADVAGWLSSAPAQREDSLTQARLILKLAIPQMCCSGSAQPKPLVEPESLCRTMTVI